MTNTSKHLFIAKLAKTIGKPVSILDTETTGIGAPKTIGIVQFAILTVHPDGKEVPYETLINPEMKIPAEASRVHHIYDNHVANKDPFRAIANSIRKAYQTRIISGFNIETYDTPVIRANMESALGAGSFPECSQLDVRRIYTKGKNGVRGKLSEVAEMFGIEVKNAHNALGDVMMTAGILDAMIEQYGTKYVLNYLTLTPGSTAGNTQNNPKEQQQASVKTAQPVVKKQAKQNTESAILEFLASTDKQLLRSSYQELSDKLGVSQTTLSFAISALIQKGAVDLNRIGDREELQRILCVLPSIYAEEQKLAGLGVQVKLTPLLERVRKTGIDSDFVQLRIALQLMDMGKTLVMDNQQNQVLSRS